MPDAGSVHVDVLPDLKGFGPSLRSQLKAVAAKEAVQVPVDANTKPAIAKLVGLEKAANRLDGRTINLNVRTRQTGGGLPPPAAGARGGGARGGGGGQSFTGLSPAAGAGVAIGGPALVPAVGALTGALGGLVSGFGAATAASGAFAVGVVPAIMDVANVLSLQEAAAEGGAEATKQYQQALNQLTPAARGTVDAWGSLTDAYEQWQRGLQSDTLPVVTRGIELLESQLPSLTPIIRGAAAGFDGLLASSEAALAGPHWTRFTDFAARQAEPSIGILGRSVGNLAVGFTGLMVSFEPLWNTLGPGMEDLTSKFAAWANTSSNFTGFIDWTIANGPTFVDTFGSIAGAAIDVGVAIAPLGTVYAKGLGVLAEAISWVADTAPWLIQLAVAAKTAQVAFSLFGRVNQGLIQPARELPGRIRDMTTSFGGVAPAADTAASSTSRFRGAVGGAAAALGGPWGIAIAAGITALGIFATQKAAAAAKVQEYTDAIREDSGAIGENTRQVAVNALEQEGLLEAASNTGLSLQLVTDAALGQGDAMDQLNNKINDQVRALETQYAQGELTHEQYSVRRAQLDEVRDGVIGETAAIDESVAAHQREQEALAVGTEQQTGYNSSVGEGARKVRDLKTALDELTGSNITATEAEIRFEEAIDQATAGVAENGATLNINTEAGRANKRNLGDLRDATIEHLSAMNDNNAGAKELRAEHERARKKFIQVARQMGLTKQEAKDLANEYLGMPGEVNTLIGVNAKGRWSLIEGFSDKPIPRGGATIGLAAGGPVHGAGTATSDSIPAMLSDGEFVQPTSTVDYYGVGFMEAIRQRQLPKGALPGFASGGWVTRGTGPNVWDEVDDHRQDTTRSWSRAVNELISSIGEQAAEEWKEFAGGPMGVVKLAEASIGKYPESGGNNTNAITSWYGMNGAPWCFAAGTLVQGADGLVEIQNIAPGDSVRTPSGAVREVRAVYRRQKPLMRVRILGAPDTLATADHPYMTERGWVKAGQLRRGDKVAKPVPATGEESVSSDYAWLVGLYVAEGYRGHRDHCVTFCVAHGETEDVAAAIKRAGFEPYTAHHRTCSLVSIYDRDLYAALGAAGDGADAKQVPEFVYSWDAAGRAAFVEGYVSGDGHRPASRRGVVACTTVSKRLTVSLTGVLSTLGVSAAVRTTRPERVEAIEGRTVSCREQFVIEWREHPSQRAQHRFDGGVLWVPVRSVVDTGAVDTVYDIEVADEHAFIANGVHVHNCAMFISWLFAKTGQSRALGGAARTAWTGDYYTSGMRRTSSPMPGDVAVYGRNHVNLVASPGGGRRIGGNQSNNVTAGSSYSGGAIFRPKWGFAEGGLVDILRQDEQEDGKHPLLDYPQLAGLAGGGTARGWTVVGEQGPELARFDTSAQVYSTQESARMLAEAARAGSSGVRGGDGASSPLIGTYEQHLHNGEATFRNAFSEVNHGLRVARKGGVHSGG